MLSVRWAPRGRGLVSGLVVLVMSGPLMMMLTPAPAEAMVGGRPPGGSYRPLTPARIVDARTGLGVMAQGPSRRLIVSTAGRAGVPAVGVSAVAVNISVIGGSTPGFVTAYPSGSPAPGASSVSFTAHQTVSQMAVVAVNGSGKFTLEASTPALLLVDVEGYFTSPATATTRGLFNTVVPARIMDTRGQAGAGPAGPLGPGQTRVLQVTGSSGIPSAGVSAVLINTTVTGATMPGSVIVHKTGSRRPALSTVSFTTGQTASNRAIVPVGTDGRISIYNSSGTAQVMIDVSGFFTDGVLNTKGGYYVPVSASRLVDTRFWQTSSYLSTRWLMTQKIAGQTCIVSPVDTVCGRNLVPPVSAAARPIAAILNITAVPTGFSGYLTAFAADSPVPPSRDVSYTGTTAASSMTFAGLSSRGEVSVHVSGGLAHVVEDVSGYFALPAAATASALSVAAPSPSAASPRR